jgi:hemin uptake protein HemP
VYVQPQPDVRVRKVLRDGMLLIERDGQLYTLEGRKAE